jgi:hypothetical protein
MGVATDRTAAASQRRGAARGAEAPMRDGSEEAYSARAGSRRGRGWCPPRAAVRWRWGRPEDAPRPPAPPPRHSECRESAAAAAAAAASRVRQPPKSAESRTPGDTIYTGSYHGQLAGGELGEDKVAVVVYLKGARGDEVLRQRVAQQPRRHARAHLIVRQVRLPWRDRKPQRAEQLW